jgi:hypothetical protein
MVIFTGVLSGFTNRRLQQAAPPAAIKMPVARQSKLGAASGDESSQLAGIGAQNTLDQRTACVSLRWPPQQRAEFTLGLSYF